MTWIEMLANHEALILVVAALTAALVAALAIWIRALFHQERGGEQVAERGRPAGRVKRERPQG
jgi:hypothetical protein